MDRLGFQIARTKYRNWRERVAMALYHLGHLLDAVVFFCTLGFFTSDYGAFILFDPEVEAWVDGSD